MRLSWNYLNDLGGVPERDDVRFHVAIRETNTPTGGGTPAPADFRQSSKRRESAHKDQWRDLYRWPESDLKGDFLCRPSSLDRSGAHGGRPAVSRRIPGGETQTLSDSSCGEEVLLRSESRKIQFDRSRCFGRCPLACKRRVCGQGSAASVCRELSRHGVDRHREERESACRA